MNDAQQTARTATQHGARSHPASKPIRWAADVVGMMREGARVRLDYSARSLWRVDRMIEELRREGTPWAAAESVVRGFGAYAGEVIVRASGGDWVSSDGELWVRTPDGRYWDPIDEARRSYAGDGSLRLLCLDALGDFAPAAPTQSRPQGAPPPGPRSA
ncbi:hypothetical protein [Streptomyces sp. NPDC046862]|uniref:hypothetical protein n=1 Tax=Streptomyces sp. NPDC046862 TaxID=3154603 RepID=UPI0034529403